LEQPVLGVRSPAVSSMTESAHVEQKPATRLRVALETPAPELEAKLRPQTEIEIVNGKYDLLVRRAENQWAIYDSSSVLIQGFAIAETDAVVARLKAHAQSAQLRLWTSPGQTFNVRIDAEPATGSGYDRLRSTFRIGEKVRFRISSEQPAYLLLLDIDKSGKVTVVFPGP